MTDVRAHSSRVRTVFLGTGGFGKESFRRLDDHPDVQLVGVVTAPPRPAGRKQRLTGSVISSVADELGVKSILMPERLRDPESISAVLALEPDLLVLADYGQIVPEPLLGLRHGALNLHPSVLPRHRGATPIPATILAGDAETGVTLMRMDAGLDTGPIVAQERMALDGSETAPGLEEVLMMVADGLLDRSLGPWIRGEIVARQQLSEGASVTRPLERGDGRLDPSSRAVELWRQVRAYQPWPGSFVSTPFGRLVVWKASVRPMTGVVPGRFAIDGLDTVDGRLLLHEVQPAGGKRMPWDAFVRGHPGIVGSAAVASDS
ncbi:MAG: methionyl-tRNA formyltransferase [Chloroflexota bacterium]